MHAKTLGDAQEESEQEEMAWNNDWDDNDSTRALESQQMLNPTRNSMLPDEEDDEIEHEIRVNLSSKIRSSLHAYKIASIAPVMDFGRVNPQFDGMPDSTDPDIGPIG